jgi:hypothetical protein
MAFTSGLTDPYDPTRIEEKEKPMNDKLSRRARIQLGATWGAGAGAIAALGTAACGKEKARVLVCDDTTGLPPDAVALRTSPAVAYGDVSTEPGKNCVGCQQFLAGPSAATCGTCKVLKGPVSPQGYCKLFVAKPA